jgi:3-methyladenine DNA glycosylase Tag
MNNDTINFTITDADTVVLLQANTQDAATWLWDTFPEDKHTWVGGQVILGSVTAEDVAEAITHEGFTFYMAVRK